MSAVSVGVRRARARDLPLVRALADRHEEAVGFLPHAAFVRYIEHGRVLLAEEAGEGCGYLLHSGRWPMMHIFQAVVALDARRQQHGLALVRWLVASAVGRGYQGITLRCADDLDANEFWAACGFEWCGHAPGGRRRGRRLNRWVLWLQPRLIVADWARPQLVRAYETGQMPLLLPGQEIGA